jgi:hypothetical protein
MREFINFGSKVRFFNHFAESYAVFYKWPLQWVFQSVLL